MRTTRLPTLPALVVGHVSHTRYRPVRHAFRHRHYQWLVDLADLPARRGPMRLLARFDARDHLDGGCSAQRFEGGRDWDRSDGDRSDGDRSDGERADGTQSGAAIRGDLERFLAAAGRRLDSSDRVLMLAHARVLGHTFDPLTVFWCLRPDGTSAAVVVEVHNTYGGRHAYLLDPDDRGSAQVDKVFYVSPFNDTTGSYDVRLVLRPDRVAVSVGLTRDGVRIMSAATTGTVVPATTSTVLTVAVRHLLMTQRVSLLIRWHGIRLWAGRLRVQARPADVADPRVTRAVSDDRLAPDADTPDADTPDADTPDAEPRDLEESLR